MTAPGEGHVMEHEPPQIPLAGCWQMIAASPHCAFVVVALDGTIRFASAAAGRLLGMQPERLHGTRFSHPISLQEPTEVRLVAADDAVRYIDARASETEWDGETYWLVALQDVTERRLTEDILRQDAIRFRTILNSAGIGIGIDDLDGRTILCNPALERILGYSQAELRGMQYVDYTYAPDVAEEAVLYSELRHGRRDLYRREKRFIRKGGDIIWGNLTVSLLRCPGQEPTGFVAMVEDISHRKRAELALQQSEERWRSLAEHTPDVILITDATGSIRYANRSFEGVPIVQLVGRKLYDCVLLEHRHQMSEAFERAVRTGELVQLEYSGVATAGVLLWNEARIWPAVVEDEVTSVTVVVSDISERKRMEDELRDHAHRLEQEVSDRTRKLRVVYGVTAATAEAYDLFTILASSLEEVRAAMPECAVAIQLLPEENGGEILVIQSGLPETIVRQMKERFTGDTPWGQVVRNPRPVLPSWTSDPARLACVPGFRAYLGVPIRADGRDSGVLSVFAMRVPRADTEDLELLTAVAGQLGRAVERSRQRQQADQAILIEERQRLARDLHDSITQLLCGQVLLADASRKLVDAGDVEQAAPYLHQLVSTARQALKEMRLMIYGLRPAALEKDGLVGALRHRLDAVERRAGIKAGLVGAITTWPKRGEEEALYHIAEELLNNVLKHAEATAVTVRLSEAGGCAELAVIDNGKGFDPAGPSSGIGLKSVQERVQSLGGTLVIDSQPGLGSHVTVRLWRRLPQR